MTSAVSRPKFLAVFAVGMLVLLCFSGSALARQGEPPVSRNLTAKSLDEIPVVSLPAVDSKVLLAEDEALQKANLVGPLRFAVAAPVALNTKNAGVWETLADGSRLWRLRFDSPGATDLNFAFTTYRMPAGGKLWIVAESEDYHEGPYTADDNKAFVELHLPAQTKRPLELELTQVATGYRDIFERDPLVNPKQGACNNDVVCPEGDGWRDQIRSAGWYTVNGVGTCSGQMIADVPGTFRSFFLTAFHCGLSAGNAASMVVIWNDESVNCGDLSGGSMSDTQTGATFLASRQDVDMALVELDDPPDPAHAVHFTGWDRTDSIPAGGAVGIHHPSLDEKAISFENDLLTTQDNCIGGGGTDTHWRVNDWDDGTTEPGSSGSGLWNPDNQLVIGFLSGGLAACGNDSFDCYGRFGVAWDGPSAASRLRDHLDPGDTGAMTALGGDPSATIFYVSNSGCRQLCQ
nr:lysyl endopeptidase-like [Nerophis lumbriciformis]